MSETSRTSLLDNARDAIKGNKRGKAIDILRKLTETETDWQITAELNDIETTYRHLCRYFIEGMPDTSRHEMLENISRRLTSVCDLLSREAGMTSEGAYYSAARMARLRKYDLGALLNEYRGLMSRISLAASVGGIPDDMNTRRYELLDQVFTTVLVSYNDRNIIDRLRRIFNDPDTDPALLGQVTDAVILSLTAWYDPDKLDLILAYIVSTEIPVSIRARLFTGLLFSLILYPQRIRESRPLTGALQCIADDESMLAMIKNTIKAIAGTKDTERVATKMKEEVIPELMKLRPEMMNRMRDFTGDLDPESLENNPEWQELLEKSGIARKLEELSMMQNDGADLMMVTFAQLKRFPFFQKINNWFLAFDSHNPELHLDETETAALDRLLEFTPFICDSDKYSLALGLAQTPAPQRRMIISQFDAQFRQMGESIKEQLPSGPVPDFNQETVKAVRDFYRYFNLGRNTGDFRNPFHRTLDFPSMPVVGDRLSDMEFVEVMAEFYLKRELYAEASPLFLRIAESDTTDSSLWQKIGFCLQKQKDFKGALKAYMKAELLGDSSIWLIKKMAFIHKKLEHYPQALEYYTKALETDPDNVPLLLNAAYMAEAAGQTSTALGHYYHAEYLHPDNIKVLRGLSWAEFTEGRYEKAIAIRNRFLSEADCIDMLNLGHAYMMTSRFSDALEAYRKAVAIDRNKFEMAFLSDRDMLTRRP